MSGRHAREAKRLTWVFGCLMTRLIAREQRWKYSHELLNRWGHIPDYPKTRGKPARF